MRVTERNKGTCRCLFWSYSGGKWVCLKRKAGLYHDLFFFLATLPKYKVNAFKTSNTALPEMSGSFGSFVSSSGLPPTLHFSSQSSFFTVMPLSQALSSCITPSHASQVSMIQILPHVFDHPYCYLKDTLPELGQREFCPGSTAMASDIPKLTLMLWRLGRKEKGVN